MTAILPTLYKLFLVVNKRFGHIYDPHNFWEVPSDQKIYPKGLLFKSSLSTIFYLICFILLCI